MGKTHDSDHTLWLSYVSIWEIRNYEALTL